MLVIDLIHPFIHSSILLLQHLMNEWLSEKAQDLQKPLSIKTEPLEVNTALDSSDKNSEFIKCVPSPHATPLSHLRRSSFSGTYTPKSFNSPAPSQLDCNLGSAKKVNICFLYTVKPACFEHQGLKLLHFKLIHSKCLFSKWALEGKRKQDYDFYFYFYPLRWRALFISSLVRKNNIFERKPTIVCSTRFTRDRIKHQINNYE